MRKGMETIRFKSNVSYYPEKSTINGHWKKKNGEKNGQVPLIIQHLKLSENWGMGM